MQENQPNITSQFYDCLSRESRYIREEVFMKEQGFQNEFDEWDDKVWHIVLFVDKSPAATGRLLPCDGNNAYVIGRVAVLPEYRNMHLGREVMKKLEEKARSLGGTKLQLSAQCQARGFYEKMEYTATGAPYMDEFCEHILMEKKLCRSHV